MKQVKSLADDVGRLNWFFDQTSYQGPAFHEVPGRSPDRNPQGQKPSDMLDDLTKQVYKEYQVPFGGLLDRFRKTCERLNKEVHQPILWHDMEAALAVPLDQAESVNQNAGLRLSLLKNSRLISSKLQEEKAKIGAADDRRTPARRAGEPADNAGPGNHRAARGGKPPSVSRIHAGQAGRVLEEHAGQGRGQPQG